MAHHDRRKGDQELVLALAGGATVRDAAERAGVAERTVYRRLEDAGFRQQVAQTRGQMVERGVGLLADAAATAVETLQALLESPSDTVRLGAARSVLDLGRKLREAADMDDRIEELEQRAGVLIVEDGNWYGNAHRLDQKQN